MSHAETFDMLPVATVDEALSPESNTYRWNVLLKAQSSRSYILINVKQKKLLFYNNV